MIQKHKLVFKHLLSFNSRFLSFIREYTINNQRKNYLHFLLMKVQRDNIDKKTFIFLKNICSIMPIALVLQYGNYF